MTIASEITRIKTAIADAYIACQDMGATMPAVLNSDNLEQCIASISGGGGSATVLHLYDRVDGKATVAGFWTDGNGQRYAVCVADAAYRTQTNGGKYWGATSISLPIPGYASSSAALAAGESGTYNTNAILGITGYRFPAFTFAKNACTVIVDNQTFESCLPNLAELQMLYNDRIALDTYDPTTLDYDASTLTNWSFGGYAATWSSMYHPNGYAWNINRNGNIGAMQGNNNGGVCPIFEIPVDENGEVQ